MSGNNFLGDGYAYPEVRRRQLAFRGYRYPLPTLALIHVQLRANVIRLFLIVDESCFVLWRDPQ